MAVINPYLNFKGNAEEAFNFYKTVFGGEFAMVMRFKEVPAEAGSNAPEDQDKIMHIALPLGKGNVLMASDVVGDMCNSLTEGNNVTLSLSTESKEEADELYKKLSAGGNVTMPIGDTFWGAYFGMATDKFGINWMISYDANHQPA